VNPAIALIASYFIGAIPTGVWLGKAWKGIDVRQHGSGNLGATNVFRVLGKGPGSVTLALDILKGLLPVLVAQHYWPNYPGMAILSGLLAIIGHMTSPFARFKGGKGVATSAGVFAALLPIPTAAAVIAFILVFGISGYVSLGSLVAAAVLAGTACFLPVLVLLKGLAVLIAVLVFWTHRGNIQRLRQGTENRILWGSKKS